MTRSDGIGGPETTEPGPVKPKRKGDREGLRQIRVGFSCILYAKHSRGAGRRLEPYQVLSFAVLMMMLAKNERFARIKEEKNHRSNVIISIT